MTEYPYGYCGMPCALCPRYRSSGTSRCLGCSHGGYYTDVCRVFRCCREKQLAQCGECPEYFCARLGKMGDFRDLDTGQVKRRNCEYILSRGFDEWYGEYARKAKLLGEALECYNNGRMKRFLCELFIRQPLSSLERIMSTAASEIDESLALKEKGARFVQLANELGSPRVTLRGLCDGDIPTFERWLQCEHVARWYKQPEEWLREVREREGEFRFVHHFIVEYGGRPVGFCQYYLYADSGETWHRDLDIRGAYSIDYLVGETNVLKKGLGAAAVLALLEKIRGIPDARLVIVQPEKENLASRATLTSTGFEYDKERGLYYKRLRAN